MNAHATPVPETLSTSADLVRVARFPNLRALAWDGDQLYASRGYELLRARMQNPSQKMSWQTIARYRSAWRHRLTSANRLTSRIFRDGFHALVVLPAGGIVAAVAGAILTLRPNETEFRTTHVMTRGKRPLHATAVPSGAIFWGEYFDNAARDEVHIYGSADGGTTWHIAYTFPRQSIRHVHNIIHDPWEGCLWVLTGDHGDECRILRASCDFSRVETVLQGNQQTRSAALVPMRDGLYFSSDTPLEANYIYRLDRCGKLDRLAAITSSSIYGCRVGERVFFSTMIEPSQVNRDRAVRIYGGQGNTWQALAAWKKDHWPMGLFQYGNGFLPDGNNTTPFLALTTIAVDGDDMALSVCRTGAPPLP